MVGTPGNKAAKKARQGAVAPPSRAGKKDAVAYEVEEISFNHAPAGSYQFFKRSGDPEGTRRGIIHACPCGCGMLGSLYFAGQNPGGAEWNVEGEWPKVSLTPSIGFYGQNKRDQGFHWHGYLRNGIFEEC